MTAVTQPPPENPYGPPDPNQPPAYGSQPPPPQQPQQQPQQPYGAPPPGAYGQVPYGAYPVQDHPQSTMVLVLGILSLLLCQVVGPFAWVMGNRALREIDASGGQIGGRGTVQAGRICGIIATIFLALGLLALVAVVILAVVAAGTSTSP
jgi:hypothetical protein